MTLRQAPARNVVVVIVVVLAFALTGLAFLLSAWMGALSIAITPIEDLKITDVQFSKGFLTVTVKNTGDTRYDWEVVTVTEVMVQPERDLHDSNQTVTPYKVPMNIPVRIGEEHSISVSYDWISGEAYQVRLGSARGNYWLFRYAVAP